MNILFSCDEYPPAPTGGIGSATKTVAEALARRGHNVYVVSGRLDKKLPEVAVINGVTVYRIYLMQKYSWLFTSNCIVNLFHKIILKFGLLANSAVNEYHRIQLFIEKIITEKKIDVVELPDYTILSNYYSFSKLNFYHRLSVPTIARVHGSVSFLRYFRDGFMHPISRANDKSFFESVDHILSVSQFAANFVNEKLGVQKECDVIYNPLAKGFINQAKSQNVKREKIIVFLGKIIQTKGAFNLIKAFNKFSISHPEYKLILIGGGMLEKGKLLVDPTIKDKVIFTGYLNSNQIATYLRSAAFCVIPTYFENFSVAALEVMGCENILIYSKESSGPEVINDGKDGFLVDPYDINSICEKMLYVAENISDLEFMRAKAAQKVVDMFSEDVIIEKLENYYKSVCK